MTTVGEVAIILGAALKTSQLASFKDSTAFTFGIISKVIKSLQLSIKPTTKPGAANIKSASQRKRPNMTTPNLPKVQTKESAADTKIEGTSIELKMRSKPIVKLTPNKAQTRGKKKERKEWVSNAPSQNKSTFAKQIMTQIGISPIRSRSLIKHIAIQPSLTKHIRTVDQADRN